MPDDPFRNYDAPLSDDEMLALTRSMDDMLSDDSRGLPEQEVLRLWWGTATATSRRVTVPIGLLYNELLNQQEGVVSLAEARRTMRRQVALLRATLEARPR